LLVYRSHQLPEIVALSPRSPILIGRITTLLLTSRDPSDARSAVWCCSELGSDNKTSSSLGSRLAPSRPKTGTDDEPHESEEEAADAQSEFSLSGDGSG
jgi:hypothetical protein